MEMKKTISEIFPPMTLTTTPYRIGHYMEVAMGYDSPWLEVAGIERCIDSLYFARSGDKWAMPYLITEWSDMSDLSTEEAEYRATVARREFFQFVIAPKYKSKWNRLWSVMNTDYNAIENYSMTETEIPNLTTSSTADTDTSTYGFNSTSAIPTDKAHSTGSTSQTGTRTLTRSGNIGVTTSQQMVESEIALRARNFLDIVFEDLDKELTLLIY